MPLAYDIHPDGKRFTGTTVVAKGSSAPTLLGKFNDKTAIEADHNADVTPPLKPIPPAAP